MQNTELFHDKLKKYGKVLLNIPMKDFTTFKTGGPADFLIFPDRNESVSEIIKLVKEENVPFTVVGWGSNLVVSDEGIRGIVIRMSSYEERSGKVYLTDDGRIYADAVVLKDHFLKWCLDNGFEGMEFMAGIPGCIGGGIAMNAGTFLGTFSDILDEIILCDFEGNIGSVKVKKEMAQYRKMIFDCECIILGAYFRLSVSKDPAMIKTKVDELLSDRKKKHPLEYPSAGSVFKNPDGLQSWKLVNDSGLRGFAIGGAMVSELHTNFIVNAGGATSREIRDLVSHVQKVVKEKFGVALNTEVKFIGVF